MTMAQPPTAVEVIARAWVQRDARVLLARAVGTHWWFLPGGHVEPGEPIETTLIRELAEEIGASGTVHHLRGIVEHQYRDLGVGRHEVNFVFDVSIDAADVTSREDHLEFSWIDLANLQVVELRPTAMTMLAQWSAMGGPSWNPWRPR